MNFFLRLLRPLAVWLASVTAIDVGRPGDGLVSMQSAGTEVDKSWYELYQELQDSREAWRKNPMARRVINLITSYVVGPGMTVSSEYGPLQRFIRAFWSHPQNMMDLRLDEWCDELSRSGELFPVLFTNVDGMSYVRAIPASQIAEIDWRKGDYESELRYLEPERYDGEERQIWYSPQGAGDGWAGPLMLHYAVNRPVGAVRGETDLAPILTWLKRYNRWLEDRVRLNAAVRAFLWIVQAPERFRAALEERYRRPPEAGTVIVAGENEKWQAVAPSLQARDAKEDGRAIRWMIAAGGPGTTLTDFGESEDASLATAKATGEMRRRFLMQRQGYFAFILADVVVRAFNRYVEINGLRFRAVTVADVMVSKPDISAEDNMNLAGAVLDLVKALVELRSLLGDSDGLRRFGLRLFVKFVGESISESEFERLLQGEDEPRAEAVGTVE